MNSRERLASAEHRLVKEVVAAQEHQGISASNTVRPVRGVGLSTTTVSVPWTEQQAVVWALDQKGIPGLYLRQSGGTTAVRTTEHSAATLIKKRMVVGSRTRFVHSEFVMHPRRCSIASDLASTRHVLHVTPARSHPA